MWRAQLLGLILALIGVGAAQAVRYDEIPPDLRSRLPEFVLRVIDPQALEVLTLADLAEFADAYQAGALRFVAEIQAVEHSGPITPELAALILQVPRGAPYVPERFARLAKQAYGQQIFSRLEWEVHENSDGSVNLDLYYASRDPSFWAPDVSYNTLGGWLAGVRYEDLFYGGKNRQLEYGVQFSENDTDEPRIYGSWHDNTLNGGRNALTVSASTGNEWRRRLRKTPAAADFRQREARLDLGYTFHNAARIAGLRGDVTLGGGVYGQDHFVYAGDPTAGGTAPRSDFDESGTAGYAALSWASARRDMSFTPQDGYSVSLKAEQHVGDFEFSRFSLDARGYEPQDNPLGVAPQAVKEYGRNDAKQLFPAASFAWQLQASVAEGDVPYSEEVRLGNANIVRGYIYDDYVGTKLLAARAEYRFALDQGRENEAFVFTDHALLGEDLDELEAFDSYGLGAVVRLPIYGGFKLGGYYGWAFDGSDSSYGFTFGYQF